MQIWHANQLLQNCFMLGLSILANDALKLNFCIQFIRYESIIHSLFNYSYSIHEYSSHIHYLTTIHPIFIPDSSTIYSSKIQSPLYKYQSDINLLFIQYSFPVLLSIIYSLIIHYFYYIYTFLISHL